MGMSSHHDYQQQLIIVDGVQLRIHQNRNLTTLSVDLFMAAQLQVDHQRRDSVPDMSIVQQDYKIPRLVAKTAQVFVDDLNAYYSLPAI